MTIDRLIIGVLLTLSLGNSILLFTIFRLMTDPGDTWYSSDYDDDDDDDDGDDDPVPWEPKNRISSN